MARCLLLTGETIAAVADKFCPRFVGDCKNVGDIGAAAALAISISSAALLVGRRPRRAPGSDGTYTAARRRQAPESGISSEFRLGNSRGLPTRRRGDAAAAAAG